jgi:hypothetical protein
LEGSLHADPAKADFHYVHAYFYHVSGHGTISQGRFGEERAKDLIEELRKLGPWWDRSNHTHIFSMTTDTGYCHVPVWLLCMRAMITFVRSLFSETVCCEVQVRFSHNVKGYAPVLKDSIILGHYGLIAGSLPAYSQEFVLGYEYGDRLDVVRELDVG